MNNISVKELNKSGLYLISQWRSDPRINRFIRPDKRTLEEVRRWYRVNFSGKTNKLYLISHDGNAIGYFIIEGFDRINRKCEFGIIIGEIDFHNKGIGLSVIKMMLKKAFDDMGMHRILAVINEDNVASIKCFSKAGFILEGRQREGTIIDNEYKDLLLYSIIEDEWRNRKHPIVK
jgi:RimJ/RimL family protein N-acetyltransferase